MIPIPYRTDIPIYTGDKMSQEYKRITYRGIRPDDPDGRNGLRNPERGLRLETVIARTPDDLTKWGRKFLFHEFTEDGVTLTQAYCYLTQYWNSDIAPEKLSALEADFAAARQLGVKFILRFAYENTYNRVFPTLERLKSHMKQLKPVLDRNWDVIYVLQAGWMGLWGEFHSNIRNFDHDLSDCAEIMKETLALLPEDRFTMMRYPKRRRQVFQLWNGSLKITADNAFSNDPVARIGFFNDGTLADKSDGGTFPNHPDLGAAGNPDFDEITESAPFMPVEGELFWNHSCDIHYASAERIIERFCLHHYSTFSYVHSFSKLDGRTQNADGDPGSIDLWKTCSIDRDFLTRNNYPCSSNYFDGCSSRSAFEYIRDHLGYRLEMVDMEISDNIRPGEKFHAELHLINRGFSTMINPREFFLVLKNDAGECIEVPTGFNGQSLQPYEPGDSKRTPLLHTIQADYQLPETTPAGSWEVYLWVPDQRNRYRADYAVRLASDTPWVEFIGRGMNLLSKIKITPAEQEDQKQKYNCGDEMVCVKYSGLRPDSPNGRNALRNPERGLRLEIGMGKLPTDLVEHGAGHDQWQFNKFPADEVTVGQAYCYLTQFWNSPISDEKLQAIEEDFQYLRNLGNGAKFLLRFAYEFDGITHGPSAEQIAAHMQQLKPVLDRNWDVIYVIQCGWIGLWGEFHTSIQGLEKDPVKVAYIIRNMLDILPENRFTMMRCMRYKKTVMEQLGSGLKVNKDSAYTQKPEAKIGFFNDGTLANHWDGGTFWDPPYAAEGNKEFDAVTEEAPYLPVDGELFWSSQKFVENHVDDPDKPFHGLNMIWDSGEKAIKRFRLHHYSTLSYVHGFSGLDYSSIGGKYAYSYGTIDAWKDTPITAEWLARYKFPFSPAYFQGVENRSAFEYIRDHLGYRLEALECRFNSHIQKGGKLQIELSLVNRGFAAPVNSRPCYFVLCHGSGRVFEIPTGSNAQTFQPYQPGDPGYTPLIHKITAEVEIPEDLPDDAWTLGLWMPDEAESLRYRPDYAIRLANDLECYHIGGRAVNDLGTVYLF